MSIMLAVDILGCTGSSEERAALLHKTIQLAAELRGTMGNMFSFAAVMGALEMAQVLRGPPDNHLAVCKRPRVASPWGEGGGETFAWTIEELSESLGFLWQGPDRRAEVSRC